MSKMEDVTPKEFYVWLLRILKKASETDLPDGANIRGHPEEQKQAIRTIVSACYNYLDLDSDIVEGIKKVLIYKLSLASPQSS